VCVLALFLIHRRAANRGASAPETPRATWVAFEFGAFSILFYCADKEGTPSKKTIMSGATKKKFSAHPKNGKIPLGAPKIRGENSRRTLKNGG